MMVCCIEIPSQDQSSLEVSMQYDYRQHRSHESDVLGYFYMLTCPIEKHEDQNARFDVSMMLVF